MTPENPGSDGFVLAEAVVAAGLLAVCVLAVTDTLITAQRARAASERRLVATQYAADAVEQLRAGQRPAPLDPALGLERSATVGPWEDHPGLLRIDVTVGWTDPAPGRVALSTVVRG